MINRQDFLNALNQDIDMVRGDTVAFNFQLEGLAGDEPTFNFTCKDKPNGNTYITAELDDGITLEEYDETTDIATYSVSIAPTKTASLDLARYYYDLQMTLNDDVITLMRGRLTLLYEVTN